MRAGWGMKVRGAVFAMAMVLLLALPAAAGAHIYWANFTVASPSIGRAELDGSGAVPSFLAAGNNPTGVTADGQFIYWANSASGTISRARLDGSEVEASFITGASTPGGIAVDSHHIYWANFANGTIGRADLDGTGAVQNFITGANEPRGVAVDAQHIYWSNVGTSKIGRANLDGSGVNQAFVSATEPAEVKVDSQHIYWAGGESERIGRANLDGTGVEPEFITITGPSNVLGLAVDAEHVYWTDLNLKRIGRANLDGSGADESFMQLAVAPFGVAVDSLPRATKVAVACSPDPLVLPAAANCTVTVADTGAALLKPGASAPTGNVSLSAGGGAIAFAPSCALFPIGTARSGCQFSVSAVAAGTATVTAAYAGDELHGSGSGSTSFAVQPALPTAPTTAPPAAAVKPSNLFALSKPRLLAKQGTATITALVIGAGKLTLSGKGLTPLSKPVAGPGATELSVKPTPKAAKQLRKAGTLKLAAKVTFTPTGGDPSTKPVSVSLRFKP
jgi:virginiamycin B lyase